MRCALRWASLTMSCAVLFVGCAPLPPAQSWPELSRRLATGNPVVVTDTSGSEVRGRVAAVSTASLTLNVADASRRFEPAEVRQVRRDGDTLWNGLAWGAAFGAGGALLSDPQCSQSKCDPQVPQRLAFVAAMAAAGVGIDALHRDQTVLYRSPGSVTLRVIPMSLGCGELSIAIVMSRAAR